MRRIGLAIAAAAAMQLGASAAMAASAEMKGPDGKSMGMVTLQQTPHGVLIKAELSGLPPGGHGFHIHENGACTPDFAAAGDHFNPEGKGHGLTQEGGPHAGDMPNVFAGEDGKVTAEVIHTRVTLDEGEASVFDDNGSAIIVHENADTHGADAGAGGRLACGVIQE